MSALSVDIRRKVYGSGEAGRLASPTSNSTCARANWFACWGLRARAKTTTLNIIAGLDKAFEGEVRFADLDARRLSYVFQEPRLLPWRTMSENVALPLKGRPDAQVLAATWLDRVGLHGCHDLYPGQASAGMQRRAAIARAFAFGPTILLMDEPFVSLDEKAASELRSLFAALREAERVTTLFVTHDLAEAAALATRVLIYSASRPPSRPISPCLREGAAALALRRRSKCCVRRFSMRQMQPQPSVTGTISSRGR